MEDAYRAKLERVAKAIAKFRELDLEEQEWLKPLLSRGIQNTLDLLDLISDKPMTFEEIAEEMEISLSTVTQKLNALIDGGYPLSMDDKQAFAETGRPRKLSYLRSTIKKKLQQIIEELE